MSTIFEIGVPVFTAPNLDNVIFYYSNIEMIQEKTQKMFQSPISASGHRTFKVQGTAANHARHLTFNIRVELHKFDSEPLAAPYNSAKAFASYLLSHEDENGTFYPFYNGANLLPVKNNAGTVVTCRLVDVQFDFKVTQGALLDVCDVTIMTNDFCDIRKLVKV